MAILGNDRMSYEVSGQNWGNTPDDWFYKEATSVAVDSKDQVYVFNRGNHPMIVFDKNGEVVRTWGEGVFTNPHGVTVAPDDTLWLVDNGAHSIRQFTPDGKLLRTLAAEHGQAPLMSGTPVNGPTRVAIDPRNGEILVADGYGNAKVHRYSPDGRKLLRSWGESGTDPGRFNIVHDIDVDRDGWIYVGDRENRRIQVFSPDGGFETQWCNFSRAAAVHVSKGSEQLVYVGEYFGGTVEGYHGATQIGPRVSVLNTRGTLLARLGNESFGDEPGRFFAPHAIATDSEGSIYVAEVSYAEFGSQMDPPREIRSLQKLIRRT
jgi:DNA-binding beta-propeller fold protein YncE